MIIIFFKIFFTTVSLFIYGFSLNRLIKINEKNFFLSILKGSVLSGFLALVIHFFLPLNLVVNTFVIYPSLLKKRCKYDIRDNCPHLHWI